MTLELGLALRLRTIPSMLRICCKACEEEISFCKAPPRVAVAHTTVSCTRAPNLELSPSGLVLASQIMEQWLDELF
jgi:hypothetical protein